MARTPIIGAYKTAAGTYNVPEIPIPQGVSMVVIDFDVTDARDGDDVSYSTELSIDDGATWYAGPSGMFRGGTPHRFDGAPIDTTLVSTDTVMLPGEDLSTRRIRGTVIVTGAKRKITTGVTLN